MRIRRILFIIAFMGIITSLNAQTNIKPVNQPKVVIYYFHPTERCPIDQAIEENTRATIQSYFSKEVKSGKIKLQILNTEDIANSKVVARFDINAQALYLVKNENGKETQKDLTAFAFDYGKSNPQKFKLRMKDEIETALK